MLAVPEHATREVLGVCLKLTAVEVAAGVVAKVVEVLGEKLADFLKLEFGTPEMAQSWSSSWRGQIAVLEGR